MALALGTVGLAGSIGGGIVFVAAGVAKLRHRDVLPGVIANYRLLPPVLVAPVAAILPAAELAAGALMLAGTTIGAAAGIALLLLFAAAMAINVARGRSHIDCGCGRSQLRQPLSRAMVARNLALALLATPVLLAPAPSGFAAIAVAVAGGASLYLLTLLLDAIGGLAASPLSVATRR